MGNMICLPPDNVRPLAQKLENEISTLIESLKSKLKKAPEGRLRISMRGGAVRYYHVTSPENSVGVYISSAATPLVQRLAQKEYDKDVLVVLERQLKCVRKFLKEYHPEKIAELYERLHPARKALVTPVYLPDEEYVKRWNAVEYQGKPFDEDAPVHVTSRGERMRSKSEVLIAETLIRLGIPYRYEYPLKLKKSRKVVVVHPDFTCLNVRTRQEFIWEHYGMVDNQEYSSNMVSKWKLYVENDYLEGKNLISSYELSDLPLSIDDVEQKAKLWLL